MAIGLVRSYLDFMARMGLSIRADPPKVIDPAGREWGEPADGLRLSIHEVRREDPDQLPAVSVVMRNTGPEARTFQPSDWPHFYRFEVDAVPTAFGAKALDSARRTNAAPVTIAPGGAIETELPLGQLYSLRRGRSYTVRAVCEPFPSVRLISNAIEIRPAA